MIQKSGSFQEFYHKTTAGKNTLCTRFHEIYIKRLKKCHDMQVHFMNKITEIFKKKTGSKNQEKLILLNSLLKESYSIKFEDYVHEAFESFSINAADAHEKLLKKVKNKNKNWETQNEHIKQLMILNEYYLDLKFGDVLDVKKRGKTIIKETLNFSSSILERWFSMFDCLYLCKDVLFEHYSENHHINMKDRYFENIFGYGYEVKNYVFPPEKSQSEAHTKIAKQRRKFLQNQYLNEFSGRKIEEIKRVGSKDVQPIFFEEIIRKKVENRLSSENISIGSTN